VQRSVAHATVVFVVFIVTVIAIVLTNAAIDGLASNPSVTFSVVTPTPPARPAP
jgi:hypothetical protein